MNVTQSSSSSVWLVRTVLPRRPFCSGVSMGERERERCNRENKRDDVPKYVCVYMSPERKRELYSKQTIPLRHDKLSQAINKLANEIDIRTNIGSHTPTASWRLMRQSSERMGERERERENICHIYKLEHKGQRLSRSDMVGIKANNSASCRRPIRLQMKEWVNERAYIHKRNDTEVSRKEMETKGKS